MAQGKQFKMKANNQTSAGGANVQINAPMPVTAVEPQVGELREANEAGIASVDEILAKHPLMQQAQVVQPTRSAGTEMAPEVAAKFIPEKIRDEDQATMNSGLEKLLEYLPEDTQDLVREFVASTGTPLWHVFGGYTLRCREEGTLMSPVILPDWAEMISPNSLRACKTCGEALKPSTWGQGICCNSCAWGNAEARGHSENCTLVAVTA